MVIGRNGELKKTKITTVTWDCCACFRMHQKWAGLKAYGTLKEWFQNHKYSA